jgi:hypothetical protein
VEIFAIELQTKSSKLITLSLYRATTRDFNQFIKNLDDVLKYLYKPKVEFLICGDINTDYLIKKKPSLIINTQSVTHNFETRIQNNSSTAIDNIFVNNSRINLSSTSPIIMAYQTMMLKFSQLKYICNNKQISFKAGHQINR